MGTQRRSTPHLVEAREKIVKSGMLGTAELVDAVADALVRLQLPNYVLDPVMVATSGDRLLQPDAEQHIARRLVPLATLVTPNLDELAQFTGMKRLDPETDAVETGFS